MATLPVMNAGANSSIAFASIPTTAALTGAGTAYAPGTSIASYTWELLDRPSGSSAALSSTTAQNPTLTGVDTPGSYRLFLKGVDNLGTASESNPLKAPSSAFRVITVTTENAALSKPARGEREWHTKIHEVIDEVDSLRGDVDTHVADGTDPHTTLSLGGGVSVTNNPSSADQILVTTGTTEAAWQDPDYGYPTSAVSTLGVIECAETPIDADHPKAVVKDKLVFTAAVPGWLDDTTFTPWEVALNTKSGKTNLEASLLVFYVPVNIKMLSAAVTMQDGGDSGSYAFQLLNHTGAELVATSGGANLGSVSMPTASSNAPLVAANTSLTADVNAGTYIAVRCLSQPSTLGGGVTVTITAYQVF